MQKLGLKKQDPKLNSSEILCHLEFAESGLEQKAPHGLMEVAAQLHYFYLTLESSIIIFLCDMQHLMEELLPVIKAVQSSTLAQHSQAHECFNLETRTRILILSS